MFHSALLILSGVLFVVAALFSFAAAIGLLRLPDVYMRMHAASKAGTLGALLPLISLGFVAWDSAVFLRALAGAVFFLLTTPVSAHLLARAAYCVGIKPWAGTGTDELDGRYGDGYAYLTGHDWSEEEHP